VTSRASTAWVAALATAACGSPEPRPAEGPPVTIAVARDAGAPAASGVSAAPAAPAASGVSAAPVAVVPASTDAGADHAASAAAPDPCRGAAFDLDALPAACDAGRTESRLAALAALAASLTTDAASVRAGEEIGVTLTLTNTSKEDLAVDLRLQCAFLELQAFSGKKRADYINNTCGFGRGCGGRASHLVLEPGAKVTKHLRYKANLVRFTASCTEAVTPLPAGRYELRLDSAAASPLHALFATLRAPLVVTR
jgi:hypothetical protein